MQNRGVTAICEQLVHVLLILLNISISLCVTWFSLLGLDVARVGDRQVADLIESVPGGLEDAADHPW
jgi:hypothetical protein